MMDNDYEAGWYIKAPFTANNLHYHGRCCRTFQEVIAEFNNAIEKSIIDIFPYLLLQPTIPNPKEYKVIMYNGVCQYFNQVGGKYYSPKLGSDIAIEVMSFAKRVYDTIAARTDTIILSGLIRIDLMLLETECSYNKKLQVESKTRRLVVNEIEGVDSNFSSSNSSFQLKTQAFLHGHWARTIRKTLKNII